MVELCSTIPFAGGAEPFEGSAAATATGESQTAVLAPLLRAEPFLPDRLAARAGLLAA